MAGPGRRGRPVPCDSTTSFTASTDNGGTESGDIQRALRDSNLRPSPYHAIQAATGRNPRQRFWLVSALFAPQRFATGCHWLQPPGCIRAPSGVLCEGDEPAQAGAPEGACGRRYPGKMSAAWSGRRSGECSAGRERLVCTSPTAMFRSLPTCRSAASRSGSSPRRTPRAELHQTARKETTSNPVRSSPCLDRCNPDPPDSGTAVQLRPTRPRFPLQERSRAREVSRVD
jgi:hypothetical protein